MTAIDGTNAVGLFYNTSTITLSGGSGPGFTDETEYVVRVTGIIDGETPAAIAPFRIGFDGPILARGTADSGSTTTVVDAERTEADTDYWKDHMIVFTSGTIKGQVRRITAFNAGTDTITFSPVTTQAVGTNTYVIIAGAEVRVGAIAAGVTADANLIQVDGLATATQAAVLKLKQLSCINSTGDAFVAQSTGSNGRGMMVTGQGTGEGARFVGGGTSASAIHLNGNNGAGAQVALGASDDGARFNASAGGVGMNLNGASGIGGYGLRIQGATGVTDAEGVFIGGGDGKDAILIQAGNFSGNAAGIRITGTGTQGAIELQGGATSGPGLRSTGGAGGSGPGVDLVGGTGGHGLRSTGGSGGSGAALLGGLNGRGLLAQAQAGNGAGIESIGVGTGAGFRSLGGVTDGSALELQAQGTGNAIEAVVVGGEPLSQNIEDQLVDGVWDEVVAGTHVGSSAGNVLASILTGIGAISPAAIADAVWDEILGARAPGSAGRIVMDAYKIQRNRLKIDGTANTLTIYDDDETTPLFVYNTKDSLGAPSTTSIFERDPV